jgi:hypothetical protein
MEDRNLADSTTPSPTKAPTPAKRKSSKKRKNQIFRLVRRVHMYSGLLLLPFVLLYGLTGWLFNHPTHFAPLDSYSVEQEKVLESGFANVAPPAELAAEVVRMMKEKAEGPLQPGDFELLDAERPHFDGSMIGNANANGTEYALRINLEDKTAEFFDRPPEDDKPLRQPAPFQTRIPADDSDALIELFGREPEFKLQQLFAKQGIDTGMVRVKGGMPELRFAMRHSGKEWLVRYDAKNGRVWGSELGKDLFEVDARNFLTKMHLQKGYGDGFDMRTIWALVVDIMAVLMLFWGASGIAMWLQMKNLRRSGGLFFGAGLLLAAALAVGMFRFFVM